MAKQIRILEPDRERAVALLCDHFARDELSIDELESRLDRAHRAATREELSALFSDLPGRGREVVPAGPTMVRGQPEDRAPDEATGESQGGSPSESRESEEAPTSDAPATRRRNRNDLAMAVMSGATRKGVWQPSERTIAFACMGSVELDFREALLDPGVTEVFAVAIMGAVDIVVPPGVVVESLGTGVMGGFDDVPEPPLPYQRKRGPVLRINGVALMGGVEISIRHPGESAGEARKRRRRERKEAKRRKKLGR